MYLTLTIVDSYAKTLEEAKDKVNHALKQGHIPDALRQDLYKQAYDAAFGFVDAVINVRKYTQNEELIISLQELYMQDALELHDRMYDALGEHLKSWDSFREASSSKE